MQKVASSRLVTICSKEWATLETKVLSSSEIAERDRPITVSFDWLLR